MAPNTHEIVILDRKPGDAVIRRLVHQYFDAEAASYDRFNESTERRRAFIARINDLIAADLRTRGPVGTLLSIACGTGSRETDIRHRTGSDFCVTGVDVSAVMCAAARAAGLETMQAEWLDADLGGREFDAAVYLYSFGFAPSRDARLAELNKCARHLKRGAPFYVDLMNLDDRNEWGPELRRLFRENDLGPKGFDPGDTFYRRIGSSELAFIHYFEQAEADVLLAEAGFEVRARHHVDCGRRVGEIVGPDAGAMLFVAERR